MATFPWLSGGTGDCHPGLKEQQVVPDGQELQSGHESFVDSNLTSSIKNLVFQLRCLSLPFFFFERIFFIHSVAILGTYTACLDHTNI